MAFPVILVNSATGSDTQASGAGPATALFGTTDASTDGVGTTVTLTAGTNLSGVATDGSHAIFLNDTTAGARNFGKITGSAGSGGATPTVTVSDAFGLSLTTKSWAIGGKRASIGSTTSKKLFDNNSVAGDAMPGWSAEMQSGHTETIAATYDLRRAGDLTGGPIVLRGTSGAGTLPIVTFSNNGTCFLQRAAHIILRDFEIQNSNATKTASVAITFNTNIGGNYVFGMRVNHATNKFWKAISSSGGNAGKIADCDIANCSSNGITITHTRWIVRGNRIRSCGGIGLLLVGNSSAIVTVITDNLIHSNTGDGINKDSGATGSDLYYIDGNTLYNNGGDSIEFIPAVTLSNLGCSEFTNNVLDTAGGYQLKFTDASATAAALDALTRVTNNNSHVQVSGPYLPSGYGSNDPGADPQFVDAANGDFSLGTNLKAQGYPESNFLSLSVRSYVDIGVMQRQESGGGGLLKVGGMAGGANRS